MKRSCSLLCDNGFNFGYMHYLGRYNAHKNHNQILINDPHGYGS
jgi:hypothetical protein